MLVIVSVILCLYSLLKHIKIFNKLNNNMGKLYIGARGIKQSRYFYISIYISIYISLYESFSENGCIYIYMLFSSNSKISFSAIYP